MVTRYEDRATGRMENFKGGAGYVTNRVILPGEDMYGKGRLFNIVRLERDCEIGWHVHIGDGEGHSLINRSDEPLELVALILYS